MLGHTERMDYPDDESAHMEHGVVSQPTREENPLLCAHLPRLVHHGEPLEEMRLVCGVWVAESMAKGETLSGQQCDCEVRQAHLLQIATVDRSGEGRKQA
jgi:hypothetical protein